MKLLSLTLLPWLVRLWPKATLVEDSKDTLEELFTRLDTEFRRISDGPSFQQATLHEPPSPAPHILDLLRYRIPATLDSASFVTVTAGKINSQRLYRSPNRLKTIPKQTLPTPLQSEEELEEWLFGIKFAAEEDQTQPWWIVMQDPENEGRMLVGCFIDRPPTKDGYLWAETRSNVLTRQSLDEILELPQTIMMCKRTESGIETWSSMQNDNEVINSGVLELIGQGRSTVGQLRAIRQTFTEIPRSHPTTGARPPESFYKRVTDSLQRHLKAITRPTPVTMRLEMTDGVCHAVLVDEEDEVLQSINIEYTADLITLLRWPMVKGGPMFTDSGKFVTWSIFDDIEYKDLEFIEPFITLRAARIVPERLPKRIVQFFDETETLTLSIEHDQSVCPVALGEELEHGACWRVILPPDCPDEVRKQLGRAMTGEEMNGLLAPERLYAGKLYMLDMTPPTVSEKDEGIVFHEDRYIRMLLRRNGLILSSLEPGTYLSIRKQKWMVDIVWDSEAHVKWSAQSTVSGLFFEGSQHMIELSHGRGAKEECTRIMGIITANIPREYMTNVSNVEEKLLSGLRNLGYSETSPICELRILELSKKKCMYGVFPVDRTRREPFLTFTIEITDAASSDAIIEAIEVGLSEGEMGIYSIRNTGSFLNTITSWLKSLTLNMEDGSEELGKWTVTLSVDKERRAVLWEAEQYETKMFRTGLLYDDTKVLIGAEIRVAEREVRETFEADIVPELLNISNVSEVLKKQIPEVIQELRQLPL